jgi:hypothetical protein
MQRQCKYCKSIQRINLQDGVVLGRHTDCINQAPSPEFIRHLITTFILDVKTGNANLFQFTQQPQNNNYSKNYSQRTRNYFLLRLTKHNRHIGYDDKGALHAESIPLDTPRYVTISGRQHIGLDHRCW